VAFFRKGAEVQESRSAFTYLVSLVAHCLRSAQTLAFPL
jgi:hypothetical protein